MNEETQQKINNLSMLEQNVQQLASQRQSFQTQLIEIDSAIDEIGSEDAYKIIGSIMVKTNAAKLKEELNSKKGLLEARIKSVEKQEELIREKSKKLQEEIMSAINAENPKEENNNHAPKQSKEKKSSKDN